MNSGMILWNTELLYPKPCCPVHSALKFSAKSVFPIKQGGVEIRSWIENAELDIPAVFGTTSASNCKIIQIDRLVNTHSIDLVVKHADVCVPVRLTLASKLPLWLSCRAARCRPRCPGRPRGSWRDRRKRTSQRRCRESCILCVFLSVAWLVTPGGRRRPAGHTGSVDQWRHIVPWSDSDTTW